MEKYKILFKRSVTKDLRKIPDNDLSKILKNIENLANDPRPIGCEKLSSQEHYRIRQGNYRILYEIKDDYLIITIVKVGHRKDIYRKK